MTEASKTCFLASKLHKSPAIQSMRSLEIGITIGIPDFTTFLFLNTKSKSDLHSHYSAYFRLKY